MKKRNLFLGSLSIASALSIPLITVSCKDKGLELKVEAAEGIKLEEILPSQLKVEQIKVTTPEGWTIKGGINLEKANDKEGTITVKVKVAKDDEEKELTYELKNLKKGEEEKPGTTTTVEAKLNVTVEKLDNLKATAGEFAKHVNGSVSTIKYNDSFNWTEDFIKTMNERFTLIDENRKSFDDVLLDEGKLIFEHKGYNLNQMAAQGAKYFEGDPILNYKKEGANQLISAIDPIREGSKGDLKGNSFIPTEIQGNKLILQVRAYVHPWPNGGVEGGISTEVYKITIEIKK